MISPLAIKAFWNTAYLLPPGKPELHRDENARKIRGGLQKRKRQSAVQQLKQKLKKSTSLKYLLFAGSEAQFNAAPVLDGAVVSSLLLHAVQLAEHRRARHRFQYETEICPN